MIKHEKYRWKLSTEKIIETFLTLFRFIALAQAVLNAEIFLLGELQLVAKGQEDAMTLHV